MRWTERGLGRRAPRARAFRRATLLAGLAFTGDLLFWHLSIRHHQRRQRDLLRHHRADLGRSVRLAACLAPSRQRARSRASPSASSAARALLAQSLQIHVRRRASATSRASRRACSSASISSPCRRRGADASAARVTFESTRRHRARAVRHRRGRGACSCCRSSLSGVAGAAWHGLDQPRRRPGAARGRARANCRPTFSSLVIFLEAIAAAGFAFVFLGEPVALAQAIGGALIIAGIYVARPR